jgi:chromosomal replication initiation ATPase DnaA
MSLIVTDNRPNLRETLAAEYKDRHARWEALAQAAARVVAKAEAAKAKREAEAAAAAAAPPPEPVSKVSVDLPSTIPLPLRRIIAAVARATEIDAIEIIGKRRTFHIVRARHLAIYLVKHVRTKWGYDPIGLAFAVDHTTVMHALGTVARRLETDDDFFDLVERLKGELA